MSAGSIIIVCLGRPYAVRLVERPGQRTGRRDGLWALSWARDLATRRRWRPLDASDLLPVLASYWRAMGLELDPVTPHTNVAITSIVRITTGNFRLIERLMGQVSRILDINHLSEITAEVIEAARETLVIGT